MRRLALLVRLAPLLQRELVHGFGQQVQAVQEVLELALVGVAPLQPGPVRSPPPLARERRLPSQSSVSRCPPSRQRNSTPTGSGWHRSAYR